MATALTRTEQERNKHSYYEDRIREVVHSCSAANRDWMDRAYKLRNGKRDKEDFKYLTEAYDGFELPSEIRHIPLLKSMFDVLSGTELTAPLLYKITCKGDESFDFISQEQVVHYQNAVLQMLEKTWESRIQALRLNKPELAQQLTDAHLKKLEKESKRSFRSQLEIYGQDLIEYFLQSKDLKTHFNTMFEDKMATGAEFYQVRVEQIGFDPLFRVLNPRGLYFQKLPNKKFLREHDRWMYVEEMRPVEVLRKFGHLMDAEELARFCKRYRGAIGDSQWPLIDFKSHPDGPEESDKTGMGGELTKVRYTEWKEATEIEYEENELVFEGIEAKRVAKAKRKKYRMDLYGGYQIDEDIFVGYGKYKFPLRPVDDPSDVYLTANGSFYNDRNGDPFSLIENTKELSDKIDILHLFAENIIFSSGNKAARVNMPDIPAWLDGEPLQRVYKWLGLLKQGVELYDLSQDGQGVGKFTNYGTADLSLDASVKVIYEILDKLGETAERITGVNRQRMGDITQQDLKATTEMATANSTVVTAPLFAGHNSTMKMALTDLLNASRIAYKDGKRGSYLLGDMGQQLFTIDGSRLSLAYYDVFVDDGGKQTQKLGEMKAATAEMIKAGQLSPDQVVDMIMADSLTELSLKLKESLSQKADTASADQSQQLEQYAQKIQQLEAQIQGFKQEDLQLKAQVNQLKAQDINLRDRREAERLELEREKAKDEKEHKAALLQLEAAELSSGKGSSKEVYNS